MKVLKCNCKHAYQDELYGHNMRAHNVVPQPSSVEYRCTVCNSTRKEKE